jgi:hypothetical protein
LHGGALGGHAHDAPNDLHPFLVHDVVGAVVVEPEPVVRPAPGDDLALAGALHLAPPGPLGRLDALEACDLVHDAVGELPLRGVVSAIVEGADLGPMLLELAPDQVVVDGSRAKRSRSWAKTTDTPPAATRSLTRSIPGLSRLAPLWPGSETSSKTS